MSSDGTDRESPALLSIPALRWFLTSRVFSVFAAQIVTVSVGWNIYSITGNVLDLGLVGLAQIIPFLILFLYTGWIADRFNRKMIMILCNLGDVFIVLAIGALFWSEPDRIWPIYLLLAAHAALRSFSHPAQQALLPNLVPEQIFPNAIALTSSVLKFGQLGGPAIGGILLAATGVGAYLFAALLLIVSSIAAVLIAAPKNNENPEPFQLSTVLEGLGHVMKERLVLAAISIDLMVVLFGAVVGLLPVFVKDILMVGPEYLGFLRAAPGVGALLVAIGLSRYRPQVHIGRMFLFALMVFAGSILVFGLSQSVWISMAALFVYGASDMLSVYVRMSLVQLKTPDHLRGRVSAVNSLTINASNELGDLRAGIMGAWLGVVSSVLIGGAMTAGVAILWWRMFPQLRQLKSL